MMLGNWNNKAIVERLEYEVYDGNGDYLGIGANYYPYTLEGSPFNMLYDQDKCGIDLVVYMMSKSCEILELEHNIIIEDIGRLPFTKKQIEKSKDYMVNTNDLYEMLYNKK